MADRAIRTPRVEQTPLTETACSRREHKTADGRCHAIGHRWLTAYTYACAAALLESRGEVSRAVLALS